MICFCFSNQTRTRQVVRLTWPIVWARNTINGGKVARNSPQICNIASALQLLPANYKSEPELPNLKFVFWSNFDRQFLHRPTYIHVVLLSLWLCCLRFVLNISQLSMQILFLTQMCPKTKNFTCFCTLNAILYMTSIRSNKKQDFCHIFLPA